MTEYQQFDMQFHTNASKRKRKKQIINDLKKQISFYFSDSNLSKDKFLKNLIMKNPESYVPLETLETFNRISEMGCSRALIERSISFLPELELSDDKAMVRRITPIKFDYIADDRTIYIENLPPKMDHKRLEQALSKYGPILHISLPRFKNNKELKGFGFIEFQTTEGAKIALEGLGWVDETNETELPCEAKPSSSDKSDLVAPAKTEQEVMHPPSSLGLLPPSELSGDLSTPSGDTPDASSVFPDFCSENELLFKEEQQKKKRRRRRSSICLADLKSSDPVPESGKRDPLILVDAPSSSTASTTATQTLTNSARKRKRTSLETVSPVGTNNKVRRVLSLTNAPFGSCSESDSKQDGGGTSDAELKKQLKMVKATRRKKRRQKMKKKSELQGIRVFPKEKWNELKVMYKKLQKQQITAIKKDLGMKSEGLVIRLCGLKGENDDDIRVVFSESVVSILRDKDDISAAFIRFRTNSESHKTATLPPHLNIEYVSESMRLHVNEQLASLTTQRYLERKRKRKLRGYTKVIKKCSAKDQTSQDSPMSHY